MDEELQGSVWDYFNKCISSDNYKRAQCTFCKSIYSYATTIGNLKAHLVRRHGKYLAEVKRPRRPKELMQKWNEKFWDHFSKDDDEIDIATCNYCFSKYSCKKIHNLSLHLAKKHPVIYEKYFKNEVTDETFLDSNDSDLDETKLISKLIEKDSDNETARCVVCDVTLDSDDVRQHVREKHGVGKDATEETEFIIKEDNDESELYTEVVYLDEEQPNVSSRQNSRHKSRKFTQSSPIKRFRIRQPSESSIEEKRQKIKSRKRSSDNRVNRSKVIDDDESDDEIERFGKYVVCLLRKMPTNVSRNIQKNVINMILNAEFENGIQQNAVTSDAPNIITIQGKAVPSNPSMVSVTSGTGPVNYILVEKKDGVDITNSITSQVESETQVEA